MILPFSLLNSNGLDVLLSFRQKNLLFIQEKISRFAWKFENIELNLQFYLDFQNSYACFLPFFVELHYRLLPHF